MSGLPLYIPPILLDPNPIRRRIRKARFDRVFAKMWGIHFRTWFGKKTNMPFRKWNRRFKGLERGERI